MYSVKIEKDIDKSFMTNKYCIFSTSFHKIYTPGFSINESIEFIRNIVGDIRNLYFSFIEDYT